METAVSHYKPMIIKISYSISMKGDYSCNENLTKFDNTVTDTVVDKVIKCGLQSTQCLGCTSQIPGMSGMLYLV